MPKLAFHIHTNASNDSWSKPADIIKYCRRKGIDILVITDHNEISGALEIKVQSEGDPRVVVGEEIAAREGEVIGLFLETKITPGQSLAKTIGEIKKQGGLVCLPHPGETFRRSAISKKAVTVILNQVDIIEIWNSRTLREKDNRWAGEIAAREKKGVLGGSDAHFIGEIGRVINIIDGFNNAAEFLAVARQSKIIPPAARTSLLIQLGSKLVSLLKKR